MITAKVEKEEKSNIQALGSHAPYADFILWSTGIEIALEAEALWDPKKGIPKEDKRSNHFLKTQLRDEFRRQLQEHLSPVELFIKIEELARSIKSCLDQDFSVKDQIQILIAALPDEYLPEKRELRRSEALYLWEVKPQLVEFEAFLKAEKSFSTKPASRTTQQRPSTTKTLSCQHHPHSTNHSTEECRSTKKPARANMANSNDEPEEARVSPFVLSSHIFSLGCNERKLVEGFIMDSGASFHITHNIFEIKNFIKTTTEYVRLPNNSTAKVYGHGTIELQVDINGIPTTFTLKNVRYIPELKVNLLSEIALAEEGYEITRFKNQATIKRNGTIVATGEQEHGTGGMYYLKEHKTGKLHLTRIGLQSAHESMGHISQARIMDMSKSGKYGFELFDLKFTNCDHCSAANLTTPEQPQTCSRIATTPGEIINADIIGPLHELDPSDKYVSVMIDRASGFASVECMAKRDDRVIAKQLKSFSMTLAHPIKCIRSDNGPEYKSKYLDDIYSQENIRTEFTAPHSPAQNGMVERLNRTLLEMTKAMLKHIPSLAKDLWPYAIDYALYLYNRIPRANHGNISPHETLYGTCPDLSDCHPFGSECWYNDSPNLRTKLEDKGKPGIYVGHSPNSAAHLIMTADGKVITCRIVKFAKGSTSINKAHDKFYVTESNRTRIPNNVRVERREYRRRYSYLPIKDRFTLIYCPLHQA